MSLWSVRVARRPLWRLRIGVGCCRVPGPFFAPRAPLADRPLLQCGADVDGKAWVLSAESASCGFGAAPESWSAVGVGDDLFATTADEAHHLARACFGGLDDCEARGLYVFLVPTSKPSHSL